MSRFSRPVVCVLTALILLAGCSMPAPRPAATPNLPPTWTANPPAPTTAGTPVNAASPSGLTTPESSESPAPPVGQAPAASTPAETPSAAPAPAGTSAAPAASPTPYDYSSLPGWFAFVDFECKGLCTNVSIVRPDFSKRKPLTAHTGGLAQKLFWSPRGGQIAFTFFTGGEDGKMQLRMVNAKTGKEVTLATLAAGMEFGAVDWSPDGKFLTYAASTRDKNSQIYRVNISTRKAQNLSRKPESTDENPAWSPNGKLILFTSDRAVPGAKNPASPAAPAVAHLWTMKADGSGAKALLPAIEENQNWTALKPAWSPDGKEIAFFWLPAVDLQARGGIQPVSLGINAGGLWVMDADGKHPALVSACNTAPQEAPVWSPDGKKIAFTCGEKTRARLSIASLEDLSAIQSQSDQGMDYSISWAPDSKALVYLKKVDENQRTINLFVFAGEQSFAESANTVYENVIWSPVAKLP